MITSKSNGIAVRLEGVSKVFGPRAVVDGVSLTLHRGELYLLIGPSGSGKTTLLTLIAGLQRPTFGRIELVGLDLSGCSSVRLQRLRARSIGFVFQDFQLVDSLTVLDNIALVARFAGARRRDARRRAQELLNEFGLSHVCSRHPERLSQGEKQRVAVMRALVNDPELIIADEPTASLESEQGMQVIRLMRTLSKTRRTAIIVASHDLRLLDFADRVGRLEDGVLTEGGACDSIPLTAGPARIDSPPDRAASVRLARGCGAAPGEGSPAGAHR